VKTLFALMLVYVSSPVSGQTPGPFPDWVDVKTNIAYGEYPDTKLDLLLPRAPSVRRRPAVINIHGGGWMGPASERIFERMCLPYLAKGFVVANIEYRLSGTATAPAAVRDVLAAANWLHRNAGRYGIDSHRIVAAGSSAGGHLALMLGMTPKSADLGPPAHIAAVVNFCGITDVADLLAGENRQDYAAAWVPEQPGRQSLARLVSPMTYVRKDLPPILTLHGDADKAVPYEHSVKFTQALRRAGASTEMITVPQGPHRFTDQKLVELYPHIFEFLRSHGVF
jgi:acetyl esterase/lipase